MDLKTKEESEDPVGMMEVYQEFNSTVVQKYKILEFKSKKAKKNYAFEKFEVPNEADYLEVRYSVSIFVYLNCWMSLVLFLLLWLSLLLMLLMFTVYFPYVFTSPIANL